MNPCQPRSKPTYHLGPTASGESELPDDVDRQLILPVLSSLGQDVAEQAIFGLGQAPSAHVVLRPPNAVDRIDIDEPASTA